MDILKKLGKRVRKIRLDKDMSQGDVAKTLGVRASYISGIERGTENMSAKKMEKLAKALRVPIIELLK
jgi:transcriptional regulator with XRE-family HTH domain